MASILLSSGVISRRNLSMPSLISSDNNCAFNKVLRVQYAWPGVRLKLGDRQAGRRFRCRQTTKFDTFVVKESVDDARPNRNQEA